ncbi:UDP-N-acetylmuramoyl-tripeptide--D-alanyl-D-alanine ligase [Actinocorallia sp. A-T 12471]|uniref:UDP-N-acetylmuramoyl-tripeptide--D-alanyl-D- alanine ligase n=1 Tax=Actinocorallia sp. A-T 12471 TaxID=3089813 RepID=UPI0029CEA9F7|nr:UDP-N-acetylmuramoyl-tripeptide--D-alanyl-D-alanine ligase [Actinocorallia sp. A-T 12471]MDX6743075.1 UDP-N-acetylmuramoyl-tripeptide--D-alanyl-D-alanine ligase [Actinocorallia sp. A-T 12471]
MIGLSLARIAELTGGAAHGGPAEVTGPVVIDSRLAEPGALFVALPGERVDGHDFASAAVERGAAAVLGARALPGIPTVVVPDVVAALGALARGVLAELPELTVVGVTGSSGKTSTKDLMAQVFAAAGPTVAPAGSLNNEIGHPLTVLRADAETRYLVLEKAARGVGHIRYLAEIARPSVGVVLNVGTAHLGEFGGREAVARAKGELVEALDAAGTAVLNADDPLVAAMAERTVARVVAYGRAATADVRAEDETYDAEGRASFTLVTPEGSAPVTLRLHGAHAVSNALAAAAAARAAGLDVTLVAEALSRAVPVSRWRMEVTRRADGLTVVNDAYNANPESVRAALDALARMAEGRRTYAVLGHMAELGAASVAEHEKIGQHAARTGVAGLIAVGPDAAPLLEGAKRIGTWNGECVQVDDVGTAVAVLGERLGPRDVVLVKGSRVAGLERVAQALLADAPPEASA